MSFTGSTELNQMGGLGGSGFGGGGFGAFGLIGLLGLDSLGNRRKDDCGGPGVNELATLQAIANAKDITVAEGRALGAAICESEKTTLNQFYASAIQAANNTQSIKDQNTAFAIVNDKRFDDVTTQIANTTAAILSRINDVENQNLRDQLFETRRRVDAKENELTIVNTNTNINQQLQQQQQWQVQKDFENQRRFDSLFGSFNQLNRNTQDVINFGTMAASANQANQQTNVK
jgi:hypothetical protein